MSSLMPKNEAILSKSMAEMHTMKMKKRKLTNLLLVLLTVLRAKTVHQSLHRVRALPLLTVPQSLHQVRARTLLTAPQSLHRAKAPPLLTVPQSLRQARPPWTKGYNP